jgi:predicted AAA+ superfamily ATPase
MFIVRNKDYASNNNKIIKIAVIKGGTDTEKKALFLNLDDNKKDIEMKLIEKQYFQPVPQFRPHQNERLYIAGPSGSGKSTYLANFISQFLKTKGKNDTTIYIFSSVEHDDVIDGRFGDRIIRPDMDDDEILLDNYHPSEFEHGAIVIFDDVSKIKNPKVRVAIHILLENLLETGRHYDLTIITTSHQLSNYSRTRTQLNEATSITVFPKFSGGTFHIRQYLQKHIGLNTQEIKKFLSLARNSRWITIQKTNPMYVISAKQIYAIKDNYMDDD